MTKDELESALESLRNDAIYNLVAYQNKIPESKVPDLITEFSLWKKAQNDWQNQSQCDIQKHLIFWCKKRLANDQYRKEVIYGTIFEQGSSLDEWERECAEAVLTELASGGFNFV